MTILYHLHFGSSKVTESWRNLHSENVCMLHRYH